MFATLEERKIATEKDEFSEKYGMNKFTIT